MNYFRIEKLIENFILFNDDFFGSAGIEEMLFPK